MSEEGDFWSAVVINKQIFKEFYHLVAVTGKTTVNKEQTIGALQNKSVATARRLYGIKSYAVGKSVAADSRGKTFALVLADKLRKTADIIESLDLRLVMLVENLHQAVGKHKHIVGLTLRQAKYGAHFVGKSDVKNSAVEQTVGNFVVEDVDFANF